MTGCFIGCLAFKFLFGVSILNLHGKELRDQLAEPFVTWMGFLNVRRMKESEPYALHVTAIVRHRRTDIHAGSQLSINRCK